MLSSKSFIVSGLTFKSSVHSKFIFVSATRECSNFILIHVAVQFSKQQLLKRLSLLYSLASFVTDYLTIGTWVYFWAFYPVPMIYLSVFVPAQHRFHDYSFVVQSEVREPDFSISVFLSQGCFGYSESFVFPYTLKNFLFQFCEKCHW